MTTRPGWTFITNHGLVLSYISGNPISTAREIAGHIGVTERTAYILRVRKLAVAIAGAYASADTNDADDDVS